MKKIFRIDDIGAATKEFEQHGRKWFKLFGKKILYFPLANFWFFKTIMPFKRWAKYEELTAKEWEKFIDIFAENGIVPIVAVTACWVDEKSNLIPFPEKFKEEANVLKKAFHEGKIVVANHGLTHCVVGQHLPKFFGSNRSAWREFLPKMPVENHKEHILKSQEILETFFEKPVETFVPPGNLWSLKTFSSLRGTSIKTIMSKFLPVDGEPNFDNISFIPDSQDVYAFHDRELKLYGEKWLREIIILNKK